MRIYNHYTSFRFKKKSPRELLTRKELSMGFKKAWDLVDENFRKKNYVATYFLCWSIFEDRLNSSYKVSLWFSRSKIFHPDSEPDFNDVDNENNITKVIQLFNDGLIDEELKSNLLKVNKERNYRFHSAIWSLDKFTSESISNCITGARELDRVRIKQKKIMGK
jgi:hypothetical protein